MAGRRRIRTVLPLVIALGAAVFVIFLRDEPPSREGEAGAPVAAVAPPPPKAPVVRPHPQLHATARIAGVGGAPTQGSVRLIARPEGGVAVDYRLENLPPGKHAMAVRETGDCSAAEGAEGVGEIGEVVANVMGRTRGQLVQEGLSLGQGPADALGRVVVVREGSGTGRILGCGVLEGG